MIGPSRTIGAVKPVRRSPATKVVVFQCPCGTDARKRSPFGARPFLRAMFVVAQAGADDNPLAHATSARGRRGAEYEHTVAMVGVAIGEAALDATMAVIGLAVFPGNHAHDFLAAHLGLEGAADAAIGAGGDGRMFGQTDLDDRLLLKRGRWAGLHTGAKGYAFGVKEGLAHAGRYAAAEAATSDGQCESPLNFLTGPHATIADNA